VATILPSVDPRHNLLRFTLMFLRTGVMTVNPQCSGADLPPLPTLLGHAPALAATFKRRFRLPPRAAFLLPGGGSTSDVTVRLRHCQAGCQASFLVPNHSRVGMLQCPKPRKRPPLAQGRAQWCRRAECRGTGAGRFPGAGDGERQTLASRRGQLPGRRGRPKRSLLAEKGPKRYRKGTGLVQVWP
jgi:hypothetical protein